MRAGGLELARQGEVIVERVLALLRIAQVARVAQRRLAQLAAFEHRVDGDAHVLDPVERIENAEHVDAGGRGALHEEAHHVVGIVGIADRVGRAQQHLQQQVRHALAQRRQALPGVLAQKAQRHIEGRPAPALHREQLRQQRRVVRRDRGHVARAQARGDERLVGIAHAGVGQEHPFLLEQPVREARRTELVQLLLGTGRRRRQRHRRQAHRGKSGRTRAVLGLGVAVDDDVADEGEDAAGAVALARPVQQRRRRLDEARGVVPAREARVRDELIEEAQVGDHAADAEFRERAVHARDGLLRRGRPGSHLHQQRVIGARDDRAGVGGAGVQTHAEAGGTAVGGDLAVVGNEVVFRILGGDAALQRVRTDADLRLRRHAALGGADARAGGDAQLRLDEVDAGGAFGDRVLNLDAGVDLDEVEAAAVRILQEFHRAGVLVGGGARDVERHRAQPGSLLRLQKHRRAALDHLLVAPLRGAVALEQVHQRAVRVAEHLHLDVAGAAHQLLRIHRVIAKPGERLAARGGEQLRELRLALHHARAAPAAAPAGLEHHRVADLRHRARALECIVRQRPGRRHHRHTGRHGERARGHLVAQQAHGLGGGSDEHDAGRGAGFGELGVLGEKAVARMDRIHLRPACDAQDVGDVQIGLDRPLTRAHQVGLVRLGPVQRKAVFLGVDGDRAQTELVGRPHDANGDLAAVGDQDAADPLRAGGFHSKIHHVSPVRRARA